MTKKQFYLFVISFGLFIAKGYGQQIGINEDGSLPNPSAILDVKSVKKGVLIPRMSSAERVAIPGTVGLLVYDTSTRSFWYHNGASWQNMVSGPMNSTGWSLTGNNNTDETSFLGTINNKPLKIRVANIPSGAIDASTENAFWGYKAGGTGGINTYARNTAIGTYALQSIGSGGSNVAVGVHALSSNTSGSNNTASGAHALSYNTTGGDNVAAGFAAMFKNTTGYGNTAHGAWAMAQTSTGVENAAYGGYAIFENHGSYNTGVGYASLYNNRASYNTALGHSSMRANWEGTDNTAIGERAMYLNTSGSFNAALGNSALFYNTTGYFNTAIGSFAGVSSGSLFNATAIGFNAIVNNSNKIRIGNSAITSIEGQVPFTTPSDGRFKYDVQENIKGLDFILHLRPVTYRFDVKRFDEQQMSRRNDSARALIDEKMEAAYRDATAIRRSGFIAQEVEKAANLSGYDFSGLIKPKTEGDHYSLSYESFVVPLVKAIQELNRKVEDLQKENESLRKEIHQLVSLSSK